MNIEPDTHIEIRQTRSEISVLYEAEYRIAVLDEIARKFEGVLDDALLTRLGYVKRETCRIDVFDNLNESEGNGDVWLECSACHWQMDYAEAPTMPLNYCPNCGRTITD